MRNVSDKDIFNFYFLKVNISLSMHDPHLKCYMYIENTAVEGTVSQIFYVSSSSFSIKFIK